MREPDIDGDDFEVITRKFEECTGKWTGQPDRGFEGAHWKRDHTGELACFNAPITKHNTRRMLSQIDAKLKSYGTRPYFV